MQKIQIYVFEYIGGGSSSMSYQKSLWEQKGKINQGGDMSW